MNDVDEGVSDTSAALIDITSLIEECASSLTLKEPFLCNRDSFSLHDSMAATELLDRKMDCCQIPVTHYCPIDHDEETSEGLPKVVFPRPAPTCLDDDFSPLPWEELTTRTAAFITMEMLLRLQSFLSGSSVGESIFTCLYAHSSVLEDMKTKLFRDGTALKDGFEGPSRENYPQFIVFTCTVAVVEITSVARGIVVNADIYEEEDFSPNTYDIPFYPPEGEEIDILALLKRAVEMSKDHSLKGDVDNDVIALIIGFLFGFLSTITFLGRISSEQLKKEVMGMQEVYRLAALRLEHLSSSSKAVLSLENDDDLKRLKPRVFDSFVNRPKVGNTPVRQPFFKSYMDSIISLQTIVSELDWALFNLLLRGSTIGRVRRMLDRVYRFETNILTRSLIILNLYFEDKLLGQYPLQQLVLADMRRWMHVPETLIASDHSQAFIARLCKPIYDTLKLSLLNHCRQRSYIEAVMLNDWIALQDEARLYDLNYRQENGLDKSTPPYFSQYVLVNLLKIMDRYISVGVELGIYYGPNDISFAFWYRDFVLSALLNQLSAMRRNKTDAKPQLDKPSNDKGKGRKKGNKGKNKAASSIEREQTKEDQEDEFEMMLISLKRDLCRGLKRFIACLKQAKVIKDQPWRFTSLERIFEERFSAFQLISQPPSLTYADYMTGVDFSNLSQNDLLANTSECFQASKQILDGLLAIHPTLDPAFAPLQEAELRSLLKVCVGNSVYLLRMRSSVGSSAKTESPNLNAALEFERLSQFCTIKLS